MSPPAAAALFAAFLVLAIAGFLVAVGYNAVVALRNRVDKAWGNIEVTLRQRHDMLPALVDAVHDVMTFERDVLTEVARQRARYAPNAPVPEQGAVSQATSAAVRSLLAVAEAYPQLRSQDNVLRLQEQIQRLEEQIADRRELYNDQVFRYNTALASVPTNVLTWLFGWTVRDFFAVGPADRERPDVRLRDAAPGTGTDHGGPSGE